jgi:hypothetical protein
MVSDLDQCDLDRMELTKLKVELEKSNDEIARISSSNLSLKGELSRAQLSNDTLSQEMLNLSVTVGKANSKLKKSRNWWAMTAIAGVLSAIVVHYHWKYADAKD